MTEANWVIRKRGYFYRPNRRGYTASIAEAGRYTEKEAKDEATIEKSITAHPASEYEPPIAALPAAPKSCPKCQWPIAEAKRCECREENCPLREPECRAGERDDDVMEATAILASLQEQTDYPIIRSAVHVIETLLRRLSAPPRSAEGWQTRERVIQWRERNSGHNGRLAGHALRMLHEVIEVCVAAGSSRAEIECRTASELDKAERKGEFASEVTLGSVREELADVTFLVDVLAHCTGNVDLEAERLAKLGILDKRAWEADADGVLWRPGHIPAAPLVAEPGE